MNANTARVPQPDDHDSHLSGAGQHVMNALLARREDFVSTLVQNGLVSQDFVETGIMNRFAIHPDNGLDALMHVLVGDMDGGAHHLATIASLGIAGRELACRIHKPESSDGWGKQYRKYRQEQQPKDSGTYKVLHVHIHGLDHSTGEHITYAKSGGSSMFPDSWSTEQVLEALVAVADTEPTRHDEERHSFTHVAEVGGVKIQVVTNELDGRIITGCPR